MLNQPLGETFRYLGKSAKTWTTPTDIPASEAAELKKLYQLTAGRSWTDHTNWGKTATANEWYGITVSGGKVQQIGLGSNNLNGSVAVFDPSVFSGLLYLLLNSNSVSGDISGWSFPATLAQLQLHVTSVSGDISGWTIPSAANTILFYLNSTSVSGDLSTWSFPANFWRLRAGSTSISGVPDFTSASKLNELQVQNSGLSQAEVDGWVQGIYDNWANLTDPSPTLNIGSDNAAPSGVYQDGDPPTTGLEYIYEIANDPESTGNNTWSVVYNGGSAP